MEGQGYNVHKIQGLRINRIGLRNAGQLQAGGVDGDQDTGGEGVLEVSRDAGEDVDDKEEEGDSHLMYLVLCCDDR
jgi:hypothetical protein